MMETREEKTEMSQEQGGIPGYSVSAFGGCVVIVMGRYGFAVSPAEAREYAVFQSDQVKDLSPEYREPVDEWVAEVLMCADAADGGKGVS